jgi:hypothetical protein
MLGLKPHEPCTLVLMIVCTHCKVPALIMAAQLDSTTACPNEACGQSYSTSGQALMRRVARENKKRVRD